MSENWIRFSLILLTTVSLLVQVFISHKAITRKDGNAADYGIVPLNMPEISCNIFYSFILFFHVELRIFLVHNAEVLSILFLIGAGVCMNQCFCILPFYVPRYRSFTILSPRSANWSPHLYRRGFAQLCGAERVIKNGYAGICGVRSGRVLEIWKITAWGLGFNAWWSLLLFL